MQRNIKSTNLIPVFLIVALVGTVIVLLMPIGMFRDPQMAYKSQVLSSVKQISIANIIYNADFDETFPPVQSQITYHALMTPYIKNPNIFTTGEEEYGTNIRFNTRLANVKQKSIDTPHQAVMVHTYFHIKSRKPSSSIITAHADTSAKSLPSESWPDFHTALDRLYPRVSEDFYPIDAIPHP